MNTSGKKSVVEMHGCIVCARLFNILAVYTSDDKLVECTVTSYGGHIVPDESNPLVACDTHTVKEIESAHIRWQSTKGKASDHEQEEE